MSEPTLTDLIAAHLTELIADAPEEDNYDAGYVAALADLRDSAAFKSVVEQHTNGRMAELEATIVRVKDAVSGLPACDKYQPDDTISCGWKNAVVEVIAALEGEQQ